MTDTTESRRAVDRKDSPITKNLLNLPGAWVDSKIQDFATDHFLLPIVIVGMLSMVCLTEWIGYLANAPRNPWGFTAMLFVTVAVFARRWRRDWSKLKRLKQGRDGERAMAEYMDSRLDPTARVFHDVPTAHGNVDHVIICTRGVFAVETKTRSKPLSRGAVVTVTADYLKVDGVKPDRDPVAQARVAATDVHQILRTFTRKPVWVTPIVVFPGWSVADHREPGAPVWVLGGTDLAGRIENNAEALTPLDVARLARHLAAFVRTSK